MMKKHVKYIYMIFFSCLFLMLSGCGKSVEQQITEQLQLGQKYLSEQNYEEAVVAFQKVIDLDSKQIEGHKGLVEAYKELGRFDEAILIQENVIDLTGNAAEERVKYAELVALNGDLEKGLQILSSINDEKDEELIKKLINEAETNIVELCFNKDFVKPEEATINGVPFWKANWNDVISAYPCDTVEDTEIHTHDENVEVYHAYHRSVAKPSQCAATFVAEAINGQLRDIDFSSEVYSRRATNEPLDYSYIPEAERPEIRALKLGDSIETVLEKIGISEVGKKYIMPHDGLIFMNYEKNWSVNDLETSWVSEIDDPKVLHFVWSKDEIKVSVCFIFDNSGTLQRLSYQRDDLM